MPRTRIRRLACSITVRTYIRAPVSVTVSMKSAASSASAWERRKSAQVGAARSGAGSIPASRRISQTVDGATVIPSVSSSPCTLRYRQLVTQREDLDVLVVVAARQQPQQRKRVRDAQVRQSQQHEAGSSRSHR